MRPRMRQLFGDMVPRKAGGKFLQLVLGLRWGAEGEEEWVAEVEPPEETMSLATLVVEFSDQEDHRQPEVEWSIHELLQRFQYRGCNYRLTEGG